MHMRSLTRSLLAAAAFALPVVVAFPQIGCASGGGEGGQSLSAEVQQATAEDGLYAVFHTSMGDVVTRLHHDKVPLTVANFVGLAEGTREWTDPNTNEKTTAPLYAGTKFHRVIKDFMVQGGDPLGTGMGGPGYKFVDEFDPSLRHDGPGVLSMANSGPGTNGSQFFITHKATPWLDDKHTVFGEVVLGQDVIDAMAEVPMSGPQGSTPVEDILLESVEIVRRGAAAQSFDAEAEFAKAAEVAREAEEQKIEAARRLLLEAGSPEDVQSSDSGLSWIVMQEGSGATPQQGNTVVAHYTGYLPDGKKFDSSVDRGTPFEVPIGVGRVIPGWDQTLIDMKIGEKRRVLIPPDLAYGARGAGGVIPPNAYLIFDIELMDIKTQ